MHEAILLFDSAFLILKLAAYQRDLARKPSNQNFLCNFDTIIQTNINPFVHAKEFAFYGRSKTP